jgi:preprotein translocase subunit SecE
MTTNSDKVIFKFSGIKWFAILLFVAAGVVLNQYYHTVNGYVRFSGWIALSALCFYTALKTSQGYSAWSLVKDAKVEARKVVWPTRQETIQTSMIVVGIVLIMSLLLFGVDGVLVWAVGLLTGVGGVS